MKVYQIILIIAACLVFGANESFAQCGPTGNEPCKTTPKVTPKKVVPKKPKVIKPKAVITSRKKPLPVPVYKSKRNEVVTKPPVKPPVKPVRDSDYYFNYALNECGSTDYDCKIANNTRAIELGGSVGAYNNRCYAYEKKGENDLAIRDCSRAIELDANNYIAYNTRASCYYNKGNYDQAIRDYNKSIELKPDYSYPYHNRGLCHLNMENYNQAVRDFTKAIELQPNYAQAYRNRASAYRGLGQTSLAEADERKAKQMDN